MQETDLARILARLSIKVESRRRQPSKDKVWLEFRCPLAPYSAAHRFTPDRRPSAAVVADTRGHASRWNCAACKQHGTMYDLTQQLKRLENKHGVDYDALSEEIIQIENTGLSQVKFGQDVGFEPPPEPLIEEAYDGLYPNAWDVPEARAYLESRGISQATAEDLNLLYDNGWDEVAQRFNAPRIMFPVRGRDGELYGFSGRDIGGQSKLKVKDYEGLPKRWMILGAERWQEGKPLIVVEGLFGYAHLIEIKVEEIANVGALLGSEMTREKAELIKLFGEKTYLLTDNDTAGDQCLFGPIHPETGEVDLNRSAIEQLKNDVPLFVPQWPVGKDDPDQLTFDEVQTMLVLTPRWGYEKKPTNNP